MPALEQTLSMAKKGAKPWIYDFWLASAIIHHHLHRHSSSSSSSPSSLSSSPSPVTIIIFFVYYLLVSSLLPSFMPRCRLVFYPCASAVSFFEAKLVLQSLRSVIRTSLQTLQRSIVQCSWDLAWATVPGHVA